MGRYHFVMPLIMSSPCQLFVETNGDDRRPALLLLNPLGTDLRIWDPMIDALTEHHFVIRFDMRGHGRSVGDPGDYRLPDLVDDALSVLDSLAVPRSHLFGSSLGGLVAMSIAANHPRRVDRLVLASTSTQLGPDHWWEQTIARIQEGGLESIADHLERRVLFSTQCQTDAAHICANSRAMLLATPDEVYISGARAILQTDFAQVAKTIRCSTLAIFGEDDPMLTYFPVTDLIDRIPDSEGVQVGGSAHRVISEQPSVVASVVNEFLTDPDGR